MRNTPPGLASRVASCPIHCNSFSGSVKKGNIVSGRAAMWICRSMTVLLSSVTIGGSPLFEFGCLLQQREMIAPELLQKLPQFRQTFRTRSIKPARSLPAVHHKPRGFEHPEMLGNRG